MSKIGKFLNNYSLLTNIFCIATVLVLIDRVYMIFNILSCNNVTNTSNESLEWNSYEYTLSFLLPLAAFTYFCSSDYSKNTNKKIVAYVVCGICIVVIFFGMLTQESNKLILFLLKKIDENIITASLKLCHEKLFDAVICGSLYLPICVSSIFLSNLFQVFYSEYGIEKLKKLEIIDYEVNLEKNKKAEIDIKLCKDLNSNEDIVISEHRRMETVLIQGSSGTGKTSRVILPMCVSDLRKKQMLNQQLDEGKDMQNFGITLIEPDGELTNNFLKNAKKIGINVLRIDPIISNSFGINPFQEREPEKVARMISETLKTMYENEDPDSSNIFFSQVTEQAIENLSILIKEVYPIIHSNKLPTLLDLLECLYDYNIVINMCEELKRNQLLSKKYETLINYFEKNFYFENRDLGIGIGRKDTEKFLYGATTQLDNLLRNKQMKSILCEKESINFDDALEKGQCISVCTRIGELGNRNSKSLGMFVISIIQNAVLRRKGDESTRIPHFLYIDEFPNFINKDTETCFTLFRKYRCGLTISIQNLSQLERTKAMKYYKQVVVSNSRTVLIFGDTNNEDSSYWNEAFGKEEKWKLGDEVSIKPLLNIKGKDDFGIEPPKINMNIYFDDVIEKWELSDLPFGQCFYRTRDGMGNVIMGIGTTEVLN